VSGMILAIVRPAQIGDEITVTGSTVSLLNVGKN